MHGSKLAVPIFMRSMKRRETKQHILRFSRYITDDIILLKTPQIAKQNASRRTKTTI